MDTAPAAMAIPAEVSEAEFRSYVISELRHLREQSKMNGDALEYLLRMAKEDEKRAEAEHV